MRIVQMTPEKRESLAKSARETVRQQREEEGYGRLTPDLVRELRAILAKRTAMDKERELYTDEALVKRYNISITPLRNAMHGRTWKHVK